MCGKTSPVRRSPSLRLIPPSEVAGPRWIARDIVRRKGYRLTPEAAAVLVAASRPMPPLNLATHLAALPHSRHDAGRWMGYITVCLQRGLLIEDGDTESDPRVRWMTEVRAEWSRFGWREAAEYHLATFDYPCVDYADRTGYLMDHERMRRYQAEEPDENRYKLEYMGNPGLPLPDVDSNRKSATARELWGDAVVPPTSLDRNALETALSLTFGTTGQRVPRTVSAPLILRTSPSGGARHPSEGYVVAKSVVGVDPGWYHVTMQPFSLRQLEYIAVDDDMLDRVFPDTCRRAPFPLGAIVIVTSLFERNMYRYREPRTFRTVHMDAGHLAGTLTITARAIGIRSAVFWGDDAGAIERTLGINGMREGYMLTIGLGDGQYGRRGNQLGRSNARG